MIRLRRVYEAASEDDGLRILVERLWPRGVSKENAAVELWLKDLAPSTGLRKWFSHDPAKWDEFRERYWAELREQADLLSLLKQRMTEGNLTFVFASRDKVHNSAVALKQFLEEEL